MDLAVFLRTLLRRWYLTLAVLLLSAAAVVLVIDRVGTSYEAEGSALVFPPMKSSTVNGEQVVAGNPYLELEAVSQARDIVIRSLTSKTVREELAELYPQAQFEATPDFSNGAPIVLFTVEAQDKDQAVDALSELIDRVPTTLVGLQRGLGLDESSLITAMPLTFDERPAPVHKAQIRAALAVGAVTLAAGLLLVGVIDALLLARRRRRAPQLGEPAHSPDPGTGGDLERGNVSERS